MRLHIVAVGRLRSGPEAELISDYRQRAERSGRPLGISSVSVIEIDERKGGSKAGEAALLDKALPRGATIVALDERGKLLSSPDFASRIASWRDTGSQDLAFVIGGADGLDPAFVRHADMALSFGKMVWPHMLARVMLSEQIYRAVSILAGAPYHRV
ncbi:23S rRNA (pseudouridine(1915)-N(3))-methyltransferase RlmH [Aliiruegeria sabulilitoris]|uniref:23S rRNA (pseudouridine(1915)-N(3))-methyltransferase RlmH n=1 Tax=Aliiruegeria sabulilitoris TaxID=1510458 RepID=UPI00082BB0C3|nr:23S rRNA (pseudouridine(1915)-N(3))-methyltransferase RlmH [Aliiruegeria sabulilitoris]NDR57804.1 23S rRNA (pseudouridine(1915)-N(3))-methyltransferase RlmH [Pseudoruegeria sp. M32A2M]